MPKLNVREVEAELLAELGGDPLEGSGFEAEEPDSYVQDEGRAVGEE